MEPWPEGTEEFRSETSTWTTYWSERCRLAPVLIETSRVAHPPDWTVLPADHDWTLAADAGQSVSSGQDVFVSPSGDVRVGFWSMPVDPDNSAETWALETWEEYEVWVEEYCQQADVGLCTGITDRAVKLCNEFWDCHPALLVPFDGSVQAFFEIIDTPPRMAVVAVWHEESDPVVAPYGGAQRLLETFLSTMDVWVARPDQIVRD